MARSKLVEYREDPRARWVPLMWTRDSFAAARMDIVFGRLLPDRSPGGRNGVRRVNSEARIDGRAVVPSPRDRDAFARLKRRAVGDAG